MLALMIFPGIKPAMSEIAEEIVDLAESVKKSSSNIAISDIETRLRWLQN